MNKKDFMFFLDENLRILGFRKRDHTWYKENQELIKIINLQKSNYGNYYYVNYGFIIKSIDIQGLESHIGGRLASIDKTENKRISDLLDFDKEIIDETRKSELKNYLVNNLLNKLDRINTENDILQELENRPHLNDVPLIVKKHFNLES